MNLPEHAGKILTGRVAFGISYEYCSSTNLVLEIENEDVAFFLTDRGVIEWRMSNIDAWLNTSVEEL
jgi:hypothetical protein